MNTNETTIEALLFVAGNDMSIKKIAETTNMKVEEVEQHLKALEEKYHDKSGVVLMRSGSKVRLATNPHIAPTIAEYLNSEVTGELTRPQLETLTIIAYRSPIIKPEIEMIRGVNCTIILRNLLMRGFVEESAGAIEPTYSVTLDFLRYLGVQDTSQLPNHDKLAADDLIERLQEATDHQIKESA
ncbi:MAG: SMC-Scp complex subunit ScpB [Parcubacteria group bacterium]|nr:SMC-Scp complex subunit ScpB [Parcubacteria group bacterium]